MTTATAGQRLVVEGTLAGPRVGRHDAQRTLQLALATVWLVDAVLQTQPFMFTRGPDGFSGMLHGAAVGNPGILGKAITWNASIVFHQPVLTGTVFALIQFLIAFGITSTRTLKPALALSVAWSLGVWWFGEGFGGLFTGAASPFGGGPGSVLFYAVVAVVVWPGQRTGAPFVAAKSMGEGAARAVWVGFWGVLTVLCVVGAGRQGAALRDLVDDLTQGEPGWLAHLDRVSGTFLLHHGTATAVLLAVVCLVTGISIFVSPDLTRLTIVVVCVVFAVIWVAVQNLGGILIGGSTDPNAAPLVILFALTYWPFEPWASGTAASPRPVAGTGVGAGAGVRP